MEMEFVTLWMTLLSETEHIGELPVQNCALKHLSAEPKMFKFSTIHFTYHELTKASEEVTF